MILRFILAMGSPVFETMFYGPTRQIADGADVCLPDIEPVAFRNLLRSVVWLGVMKIKKPWNRRVTWPSQTLINYNEICHGGRFIYTDDVSGLDDESIVPTLYAAKTYVIPQLKAACVDFMRQNIRPGNVFVLLEQAS